MANRNIGQFGDRAIQTVGKSAAKPLKAGRSGKVTAIKAEGMPQQAAGV